VRHGCYSSEGKPADHQGQQALVSYKKTPSDQTVLITGSLGSPSCLWLVRLHAGSSLCSRGEGLLWAVPALMGAQPRRHQQHPAQAEPSAASHPQLLRPSPGRRRRPLQPRQQRSLGYTREPCGTRLSTMLLLSVVMPGCGFVSEWERSVNDLKVQSSREVWKNTRQAATPLGEPYAEIGCLWVFLAFHLLTEVRKTQRKKKMWKNTSRHFQTWKPDS